MKEQEIIEVTKHGRDVKKRQEILVQVDAISRSFDMRRKAEALAFDQMRPQHLLMDAQRG